MAQQSTNAANANPPHVYNAKIGRELGQRRQFAWLERSKQWRGLSPNEWQARKVLGLGSSGLVGLWEYAGSNPSMPPNMAIKQVSADYADVLHNESKILCMIQATGTDHVVKVYKASHRDGGTGTTKTDMDELPFDDSGNNVEEREVARMYMEYCSGGDMQGWINTLNASGGLQPPEENLWRIFGCLARALHVLDRGTEDPQAPDPYWGKCFPFKVSLQAP